MASSRFMDDREAGSVTRPPEAPGWLATLPFIEHDLGTFDYIELDDNSPA